jgi:hypothetical protein
MDSWIAPRVPDRAVAKGIMMTGTRPRGTLDFDETKKNNHKYDQKEVTKIPTRVEIHHPHVVFQFPLSAIPTGNQVAYYPI